MSGAVHVVWSEGFLRYQLSAEHPLHPIRLALTMELARDLGVLTGPAVRWTEPEPASQARLRTAHTDDYLAAVRAAGDGTVDTDHGLGTPDNPTFTGMHEAAALIAGGSLAAAELVWSGRAEHAVNLAGGLHHAMPGRASGFCLYNDPAIAISALLEQGAERIAYVDIDVHHGDGVQHAFYHDPRVMTVSLHEDPRVLFPGTGFPGETGGAGAEGSAVNVALPAGTGDAGWLRAFHAVVPSVLRAFRPQLLLTQCGCDTHAEDPLADLSLTVDGQRASYAALHELAHELCGGRWVVLGGGGYGLVRVVPRAWTHLLAEVAGAPIPPGTPVPRPWLDRLGERQLPQAPPSMSDGGTAEYRPWQPGDTSAVDAAITATRRAVFPLLGLDPDDPRD